MRLNFWTKTARPTPRPWPAAFRPRVEQLMDRIVPTVTAAFDAVTGTFTVTSNDLADNFSVVSDLGSNVHFVPGVVTQNGPATISGTSKLVVIGNGGNDTISLGSLITTSLTTITVDAGADNDTVTGSGGNDTLLGGAGNDTLDGLGGDDFLAGDAGNDTVRGNAGNDTLSGGEEAGDADVVAESGNVSYDLDAGSLNAGALGTDTIAGFERADLAGGGSANTLDASGFNGPVTLRGQGGADVLVGGSFADTLIGGTGNDSYTGGGGSDTAVETVPTNAASATVVHLTNSALTADGLSSDSFSTVERVEVTGANNNTTFGMETTAITAKFVASTNTFNTVVAAVPANATLSDALLDRTSASDVELANVDRVELNGSASANVIDAFAWTGSTVINGGAGNDTLTGGVGGANVATGDTINGGAGDDIVIATPGIDQYRGDADTDTIRASFVVDGLLQDDRVNARNDNTFAINAGLAGTFERAELFGNDQDNQITVSRGVSGFTGPVTITGGGGDDTLTGGAGGGTLRGDAGDDLLRPDTDGGYLLFGGADTDTIDLFGGGSPKITLDNGFYVVQGGGSALFEAAAIERAEVSAAAEIDATNFQGDALLTGSNGSQTLRGGAGDDTLVGGSGNDFLFGNGGHDTLDGGADNDQLDGGTEDDTLTGSAGNDTLAGGAGSDLVKETFAGTVTKTVIVNTSKIIFTPATGTAFTDNHSGVNRFDITVTAGVNTVDASALGGPVTLTGGTGDDTLIGGSGADVITGGDGFDRLEGRNGADTLTGGAGNDLLFATSQPVQVDGALDVMLGGEGADTGITQESGDFFDDQGGGGGLAVYGTDGDDIITIRRQVTTEGPFAVMTINGVTASVLYRNGTTIQVFAGKGNDIVVMDESTAITWHGELYGEGGRDLLVGASRGDYLDGGDGADTLRGGAGDDTLVGGAGSDELHGAAGADVVQALGGGTDWIYVDVDDLVSKDKKDVLYWV